MAEEIKKNLLNIITSCETVQFCTFALNTYPETRTVANIVNRNKTNINDMDLYFLTRVNSNKTKQIENNKNSCLYYFNPETRRAITLFGESKIFLDRETKSFFWSDDWKKFGYTSIDDESYCIIKFTPKIYKYFLNGTNEQTGKL